MAETQAVIQTLKKALRAHPFTYAEVAEGLGMSEANVKRMFASGRMGLDRIEAICRLIDMELSDLFQLYEVSRQKIEQLTEQQEKELVADPQLLLIAVCVRNQLNYDEILKYHNIDEHDLIQRLAKLDRLKIIDWLPQNKIRLRIDQNFSWIAGGPIERFYRDTIQSEFLNGHFDRDGHRFVFGLLSKSSQALLKNRLQALAGEFIQLHLSDRKLPWDQRHNVGMSLALREWDFSILSPYIKSPK